LHARITTLFIDDGGVINNNELRAPEWQRLVAEFFVPLLGGDPTSWVDANRVVIKPLMLMFLEGPKGQDYDTWFDSYQLLWLREMAAHVGVTVPEDDSQCIKLAWQASGYITSRVPAGYPDAAEAIQELHSMGFTLYTASNEHSRQLEGYLSAMGVGEYFNRLYGADIIKTGKYSEEYYRRLFNHSGVNPNNALVVDDTPQCLAWAGSLGATTCLVSTSPSPSNHTDLVISKLSELPVILGKAK